MNSTKWRIRKLKSLSDIHREKELIHYRLEQNKNEMGERIEALKRPANIFSSVKHVAVSFLPVGIPLALMIAKIIRKRKKK